ncbi:MAG: right-handed parallel beta-helix repeat-containing protein [Deltaproteobacteria bacterium]|nr:right-handed parallel beta-helix repeat-containing protein [Deltaproteobacteria bacterium]
MKHENQQTLSSAGLWTSVASLVTALLLSTSSLVSAETVLGQCTKNPITISVSGSYILDSNPGPAAPGKDCIDVHANDVFIDLNGFVISGGGGIGINASTAADVSVTNGTVTGMTSTGIILGNDGVVQGIHANSNGNDGIDCGLNCLISGNTATDNHNVGIQATGSTISANTANHNGLAGIVAQSGSVVSNNVADRNGFTTSCLGDGITTVSQTTCIEPAGAGGVLAIGNSTQGNTGCGINLAGDSTNGFQNNVAANNSRTSPPSSTGQISGGTNLGQNLCNGSTACASSACFI